MTRAKDCIARMVVTLKEIEEKLEHENMLNPDPRLTSAEVELHVCISAFERIGKLPGAGEKWDCNKHGHVDNMGMFFGHCKHCGIEL